MEEREEIWSRVRCISERQGGGPRDLHRGAAGARGLHRGCRRAKAAAAAVRSGACVLLG
jgi:hypothetical protein